MRNKKQQPIGCPLNFSRPCSRLAQLCLAIVLPLLVLLNATILMAQSPQWPPDAVEAAPIMQQLTLPDGRVVPSTLRWNLVWADQLRPYLLTEGKIAFAAKHFVGSQKLWKEQAAQFRAHDANFLMLAYHLAAGLNPLHNDDCPDPKSLDGDGYIGVVAPEGYVSEWETHWLPWLQAEGIGVGSARYEDMFQHFDSVAVSQRVWHQDPYWLMNMDNDDWRRYLAAVTRAWMEGNENEGCFFDVAVETSAWLYNPKSQNPAPGDFDWWAAPHRPSQRSVVFTDRRDLADWSNAQYLACYQSVYRRLHEGERQYLVIPNVDQMVTTVYDPTWLDGDESGPTVDGVMMEGFGNYRGGDMYLTLERCVRHVTGRGLILIAQHSAHDAAERYRRAAMYMLVKNGNSYLNAVAEDVRWYPEYEIDLGMQSPVPATLEALRVSGSGSAGLWRRDYDYGMVLVNTGATSAAYTLPEGWEWWVVTVGGGGAVSDAGVGQPQSFTFDPAGASVTVDAGEGLILQGLPITAARGPASVATSIDVYPQPASDWLTVRMQGGAAQPVALQLTDLLGRSVYEETLSSDDIAWSGGGAQNTLTRRIALGALSPGVYVLSVARRDGSRELRRVLLRR